LVVVVAVNKPEILYVGHEAVVPSFEAWVTKPRRSDAFVACDTETSGLNPWHEELRLVQFGDMEWGWALPFPEMRPTIEWALSKLDVLTGHRIKFDSQFLWRNGLNDTGLVEDTKAMASLVSSTTSGLKQAAVLHLGVGADEGEVLLKKAMRKGKWTWGTVPKDLYEYWYYGALDTVLTARLAHRLYPIMKSHFPDLYEMEVDVSLAVMEAERRGMCIDLPYVEEQRDELRAQAASIQSKHPKLNLASPPQLLKELQAQGVPVSGTAVELLEKHRHRYPLVADILEYRRLTKLAETYFGAFADLQVDGRIHTTMNTLGARTGRMSAQDPNLQNVPKREAGAFVRRSFIPSPGNVFVLADFKQIEYRIFASLAQEPAMIQAFLDGKDMHAVTAEMALGHKPDEHERDIAKNGNFAELYFAGIPKFAATAGITQQAARDFKKKYHEAFPHIKPFGQAVMRYARSNGLAVDTKFGRRIEVDPDKLYAAINYMIQGSAADVLKRAIVRVAQTEWGQYLVLLVHDEMIFDVPIHLAAKLVQELPDLMEDRTTFAVPLLIDVTQQARWGEDE
jgi:DNA polymerase-1